MRMRWHLNLVQQAYRLPNNLARECITMPVKRTDPFACFAHIAFLRLR